MLDGGVTPTFGTEDSTHIHTIASLPCQLPSKKMSHGLCYHIGGLNYTIAMETVCGTIRPCDYHMLQLAINHICLLFRCVYAFLRCKIRSRRLGAKVAM